MIKTFNKFKTIKFGLIIKRSLDIKFLLAQILVSARNISGPVCRLNNFNNFCVGCTSSTFQFKIC